jgi:hypothetical protein
MTNLYACRAPLPGSSPFSQQQLGHVSLSPVIHPEGCVISKEGKVYHVARFEILLASERSHRTWIQVKSVAKLVQIRDLALRREEVASGRMFFHDEEDAPVEVVARCLQGPTWVPVKLWIRDAEQGDATFYYGWGSREVAIKWSVLPGAETCQVAVISDRMIPMASGQNQEL